MSSRRKPHEKTPRQKKKNPAKKTASGKSPRKKPKKRRTARTADPSDVAGAEVRFIQPYDATKLYLCPGCNRDITPGTGHMVVVPPDDPDLRRHWHRGCWTNRAGRY